MPVDRVRCHSSPRKVLAEVLGYLITHSIGKLVLFALAAIAAVLFPTVVGKGELPKTPAGYECPAPPVIKPVYRVDD